MKPSRLELDFAVSAAPAMRKGGLLLLVLGIVLAACVGEAMWTGIGELGLAEAHVTRASHALRGGAFRSESRPPDADLRASLKRAAAVADQLSVPWNDLFAALEAADSRPLGLLSTQPSARDRSLRIAGEARSMADVLAYVERLAGQPAFTQVHLVGFSSAMRDGVPVVIFNLVASWRSRS